MIIDINEELFNEVLKIVKGRSLKVHQQLQQLKPLNINDNSLVEARVIKTDRIKKRIRVALQELIQSNTKPTKYQVHKSTKIAYITLNKYFDNILDEVQNER